MEGVSNPSWLRDQIIANVRCLHPELPTRTIDIMIGRTPLNATVLGPNNEFVRQYMYYARVCYLHEDSVNLEAQGDEGEATNQVKMHRFEVFVYGPSVMGGREEALEALAGMVEDQVDGKFGIGGFRRKRV